MSSSGVYSDRTDSENESNRVTEVPSTTQQEDLFHNTTGSDFFDDEESVELHHVADGEDEEEESDDGDDEEIDDANLLRSMLRESDRAHVPVEDEDEKHCWVCFATEEDDPQAVWVHPCR